MDYAQHERIAEITLDDGKVNAMGPAFFDELNALLDRAERERPGALVLAGREGFFSAGLDIKVLPTLERDEMTRTLQAFGNTLLRVWAFPLPTVAAMTGHAVAGGLFLGFACDYRVMARGAFRLHANEHLIGLPLPTWAQVLTESLVGSGAVYTEFMLHARPYTPDEALERRMVDQVVDAGMVIARAREVAASLAGLSQPAYGISKARLRQRALDWTKPLVAKEMIAFTSSLTRSG
ncbi:MAG TPA: enoyl-CoA hydratase-related protein [Candidatus Limnocylindria bacterium]|nr:enoyl-CoA hydratase-related protein [Candidatus Limnocylindria bacterium]